MKFELTPYHRNIPIDQLLVDLKRVTIKLDKNTVTRAEYDEHGSYNSGTLINRLGSWTIALEQAGLEVTREANIPEERLFENIESVWRHLGRQPKYAEFVSPLSNYSAKPYENRYGSFRQALEAFVEYVNSDRAEIEPDQSKGHQAGPSEDVIPARVQPTHRTARQPS